jgi:putative membrane protein (TIGR04086 family)
MTITQYLSGAFFSNGIRVVLSFFLSPYLKMVSTLYQILGSWAMTIVSGTASGYLLTKNRAENHLLTGAVIGLYSYIVYVALSFLGVTNQFEEMWVFLGFLLGGLLGGRLGERGEIKLSLPGSPLNPNRNEEENRG